MNTKIDPIRDAYFAPLERAEEVSAYLFYATAVFSLVTPLIDSHSYPALYTAAQMAFAALAITGWLVGLITNLYWAPRASERRIADFVSSAFGANLTPERTRGYYNNQASDPVRKAALQLLENTWFTKEIARIMCARKRMFVGVYVVLWLLAITNRNTPIDYVLIGCQLIFSEEVIASYVRLEWLRAKTEKIFHSMYRQLSGTGVDTNQFVATVIEQIVCYENQKAASNVTLSSALFDRHNARLSEEWTKMRVSLDA